jgi:hypothetical protein
MRKYGWEDFALPLMLVFAVTFALTLRHQLTLPSAVTPAMAATETTQHPDYVITVTAKRIPAECRSAATRTAACDRFLAGDTRMELREANTRYAQRDLYGY